MYIICAIAVMITFYSFYLAKMIVQKKQSIKTNQIGKGSKPKRVVLIEKTMGLSTFSAVIAEVISIFICKPDFPDYIRITGIVVGIISIVFFALATITMKNSWRVGIPEERTSIITNGIYKISRNPAFVGFDLMYISILMIFFNIPLLICSLWAMVMLHLQILQEERWLKNVFGQGYEDYFKKVNRYIGRKNLF